MSEINDRIRQILLGSRAARQCHLCAVIVQGVPDAFRRHMQVCHPEKRRP